MNHYAAHSVEILIAEGAVVISVGEWPTEDDRTKERPMTQRFLRVKLSTADVQDPDIIPKLHALADAHEWSDTAEGSYYYVDPSAGIRPTLPAPSQFHTWDFAARGWQDLRTLVDLKALKNAEINAWRARANQTSFPYLGRAIACDALSRSDLDAVAGNIALTGNFPASFPGAWKAVDNSYVALHDVAAFTNLYTAMTTQGALNFQRAQSLKAALLQAGSLAEIEAIVWQGN